MPNRRRVSVRQIEILLDFVERNRDLAMGRYPGGPQGVLSSRDMWANLANSLNSVAEGATKPGEQWRRYWVELKCRTKNKAANRRRDGMATGGGPSRVAPLTDYEERVLALIGPVAVEGIDSVRLPVDVTSFTTADAALSSTAIEIGVADTASPVYMDVEWLEGSTTDGSLVTTTDSHPLPPPTTVSLLPPPPPTVPITTPQPPVAASSPPPPTNLPTTSPATPRGRAFRGTTSSAQRSTARVRPPQRLQRHERAPRWAYEMERRRIENDERQTEVLQRQTVVLQGMLLCMQEMRDDFRSYLSSLPSHEP